MNSVLRLFAQSEVKVHKALTRHTVEARSSEVTWASIRKLARFAILCFCLIGATVAMSADPTVTITATDMMASEPGTNTGTFTFTRSGSTATALTVNFVVNYVFWGIPKGTAVSGTDFVDMGTTVTIPAGAASTTKTVTPLDDTESEFEETVVLDLAAGTGYTVGTPGSATMVNPALLAGQGCTVL